MKLLFLALSLACLFACESAATNETDTPTEAIADNEELEEMEAEDQSDRMTQPIDWSKVSVRDSVRLARTYEIYEAGEVNTAMDYRNAAMLFQHGSDSKASGMAVAMMKKAIELDSTINKWLYAAAVDRDLMRRNEPQIYGTQYRKLNADDPWFLYEIDSTIISDAERIEYGVETLAQQRAKVISMNKKKLSELYASGKSIDEIVAESLSKDKALKDYDLSEDGINIFGYQLMNEEKNEEALKLFKLNIKLYPDGFNTFDSYGECLMKMGQTEAGIKAYKKSLELNPNNTYAAKVIAEAEKE